MAPGSKGIAANAYFATGHCVVWVGDYLPSNGGGAPSATSPLVAAAKKVDAHDVGPCK